VPAEVVYCELEPVKSELQNSENLDDDELVRFSGIASRNLEAVTGWDSFLKRTATNEVRRHGDVILGVDGHLLVRLAVPRVTAVSALAYRMNSPAAAWTAVALSLVDYDPTALRSGLVEAYLSPGCIPRALWAQVSYTAGWAGDAGDPYPSDLQEIAVWWTCWLWRSKDAPFERTANSITGTVTIPSSMPARLKLAVERWKAPWA
jgi:hypothetical protein